MSAELRRHRLRRASDGAEREGAVALSRRLLARQRAGARYRLAGDRHLSAQRAAHLAAGMAGQERARRHRGGAARRPGLRPLASLDRDLQLSLRGGPALRRGHGERVCARAQRLGCQGMARPRSAAARLDRDPDAEHRILRGRDRALRQGQALRAGSRACHAGGAARAPAVLADLCGGRAPRPAARHPRRLDLSPFDHVARLAELLHRGLRGSHPGLPVAGGEPRLRGRVREVSRAQGGAARVRG